MSLSRRSFLTASAAGLAALALPARVAAATAHMIVMKGNANGSQVWFDPLGLLVRPGDGVTWRNDDPGNSHTATAYHPANFDHPLRIPAGAEPWNSDYLLPGQTFTATFALPGVYDFFCVPHEMAGMVGRIVVAKVGAAAPPVPGNDAELMPEARGKFPSAGEIVRLGAVHRKG